MTQPAVKEKITTRLCPKCGADLEVWREMLHEEHKCFGLVSRKEATEIARQCKFLDKPCGPCIYLGSENPTSACCLCIRFGTPECEGIVCPDLKRE